MPELFGREILSHITPSGEKKVNAYQLFWVMAANNGKLPMLMYTELDLDFLGSMVPNVGVLIIQEANELPDNYHEIKLPGSISWNLIKFICKVFESKYCSQVYENFDCPTGVSPSQQTGQNPVR